METDHGSVGCDVRRQPFKIEDSASVGEGRELVALERLCIARIDELNDDAMLLAIGNLELLACKRNDEGCILGKHIAFLK